MRRRRRLSVVLGCATMSFAALVSAQAPVTLTIEEALRRAGQTSEDVAAAISGIERASAEVVRANADFLPQLSATAVYDRTLESEFEGVFSQPTSPDMTGTGGFDPSQLPFGRTNIYRLSLSLTQNLYTGGRTLARRALAKSGARSAVLELSTTRAQAILVAAQAYFDAALDARLVEIAEQTLRQAEAARDQTRIAEREGTRAEFDVLRAEVAVGNQRASLVEAQATRTVSTLRLAQLLDLPLDRPLDLRSRVDVVPFGQVDTTARELARVEAGAERAQRTAVRQAAELLRVREASYDLARAQWFPLLYFNSLYGRVAYPDDLTPAWSDFRTNWTVGLVLQVPIFSGLRTLGDVRVARAELKQARAVYEQTTELAALEVAQARQQLAAARAAWEATAGTVEQAQRAYEIAEVRVREGVSTPLELTDARLALQVGQVNRARAARALHLARIRLALLPVLPLQTPATAQLVGSATARSATPAAPPASDAARAGTAAGPSTVGQAVTQPGGLTEPLLTPGGLR